VVKAHRVAYILSTQLSSLHLARELCFTRAALGAPDTFWPAMTTYARAFLLSAIVFPLACTTLLGSTDVPSAGEGLDAADGSRGRDAATIDAPRHDARVADAGLDATLRDGGGDGSAHDAPDGDGTSSPQLDARPDTSTPGDAHAPDACPGGCVTYTTTILADGPIAYWRLDEQTGSTIAHDETMNYNGAYHGDVTFNQPGAIHGDPDTSVYLNMAMGQTGYVSVTGSFPSVATFVSQSAFTLEAWIKPTSVDTEYRGILSYEPLLDAATNQGYVIYLGGFSDSGVGFSRFDNGAEGYARDGGVVHANAGWYHIVAVHSANLSTIYVNGLLVSSRSDTEDIQSFVCSFNIGATHCGTRGFFQGWVDEVAVYAKALSLTQIDAHYTAAQ
jgi:hypothetical protein